MWFKAVVVILVIHLIKLNAVPMRQLPERPIKTQNESVTVTPIKAPTATKTATEVCLGVCAIVWSIVGSTSSRKSANLHSTRSPHNMMAWPQSFFA